MRPVWRQVSAAEQGAAEPEFEMLAPDWVAEEQLGEQFQLCPRPVGIHKVKNPCASGICRGQKSIVRRPAPGSVPASPQIILLCLRQKRTAPEQGNRGS